MAEQIQFTISMEGRQAVAAARAMQQAFERMAGATRGVGDAAGQAARKMDQLRAAQERLERQKIGLLSDLEVARTVRRAGDAMLGLAGASIRTAAEFQQLRTGLRFVAGSTAEYERQLASLQQLALSPVFSFRSAVQGSVSLQQAGLSARQAEQAMAGLAASIAIAGRSNVELDRAIDSLRDLAATGEISERELDQLARAGVPVQRYLTEAFGEVARNSRELNEHLQENGISIQRVIEIISGRLLDDFASAAQQMGTQATNSFLNFQDAVERLQDAIGTELLPSLVPLVHRFTDLVEQIGKLPPWMKQAAGATLLLGGGFAKVGGALAEGAIAVKLFQINRQLAILRGGNAVGMFARLGAAARGATAALGTAGLLGTVGLLGAAVGVAAWAVSKAATAFGEYREAARDAKEAQESFNKAVQEARDRGYIVAGDVDDPGAPMGVWRTPQTRTVADEQRRAQQEAAKAAASSAGSAKKDMDSRIRAARAAADTARLDLEMALAREASAERVGQLRARAREAEVAHARLLVQSGQDELALKRAAVEFAQEDLQLAQQRDQVQRDMADRARQMVDNMRQAALEEARAQEERARLMARVAPGLGPQADAASLRRAELEQQFGGDPNAVLRAQIEIMDEQRRRQDEARQLQQDIVDRQIEALRLGEERAGLLIELSVGQVVSQEQMRQMEEARLAIARQRADLEKASGRDSLAVLRLEVEVADRQRQAALETARESEEWARLQLEMAEIRERPEHEILALQERQWQLALQRALLEEEAGQDRLAVERAQLEIERQRSQRSQQSLQDQQRQAQEALQSAQEARRRQLEILRQERTPDIGRAVFGLGGEDIGGVLSFVRRNSQMGRVQQAFEDVMVSMAEDLERRIYLAFYDAQRQRRRYV